MTCWYVWPANARGGVMVADFPDGRCVKPGDLFTAEITDPPPGMPEGIKMAQARCERCSREAGPGRSVFHIGATQAEADAKAEGCRRPGFAFEAGTLVAYQQAVVGRAVVGAWEHFERGADTGFARYTSADTAVNDPNMAMLPPLGGAWVENEAMELARREPTPGIAYSCPSCGFYVAPNGVCNRCASLDAAQQGLRACLCPGCGRLAPLSAGLCGECTVALARGRAAAERGSAGEPAAAPDRPRRLVKG